MSKKYLSLMIAIAMLLACVVARAAAPPGSWWDSNYQYRMKISIPSGASNLSNGYAVRFTLNHASLVTATKSLASGNDVRVAYWSGTVWTELNRVLDADGTWNAASTVIWFKTQALITPGTDDNYYVYYSNVAAGTPPQNDALVFSLFDDFLGATIDATKWTTAGGPVGVATSVATVDRSESFRSVGTFPTDTIWETRASMSNASPAGFLYYFAANSSTADNNFANYMRFRADNTANDVAQLSPSTSTSFANSSPTTSQLYSFTREGVSGAARFLMNGTVVATNVSGAPGGNLVVLVRNDATSGTISMAYDWIRVRPYRNPEPVLTLATEEFVYPTPVASYSFEQASWTGAAGEVTDSGPNGLNGRAMNGAVTANTTPAITGTTGTCRYASLDGANDYIAVADNVQLDITAQISFAAWVRHRTNTYKTWEAILTKGDSAYRLHLNGGAGCNITGTLAGNTTSGLDAGLNSGCTTVDLNSNQVPAAGTWYHVAATHDGSTVKFYLNGTLINQATYNAAIGTNNFELRIGENAEQTGRQWTGDIDEVTIWNTAISQSVVQAHKAATHACNTIPHFVIQHDGYGINCIGESVTVNVRDIANNPYVGYGQQITLDTGSGKGDWSLTTGNGTLNNGTANDGIATYQWSAADTSATFSLSYKEGAASININAYQTSDITIRDNDLEGNMLWSPTGFTVTSSPLSNPPPGAIPAFASPQTAGNNFTMYITAFGVTPTDNQCGVIEAYNGAKNLKFWSQYVNPSSGTIPVTITGSNIASAPGSTAQSVTFTNGQASVTANYKDVGSINISVKDDAVGNPASPATISGGTGNFIVKPASFGIAITRTDNGAVNPAASSDTGGVFIPAGQPFTMAVRALDSTGSITPNFGLESPAESVKVDSSLVLPSPGLPSLGQMPALSGNFGVTPSSAGVFTGTNFSWDEVGIISVTPRLNDGSYMGTTDVVGSAVNVGRFIPFNFGVTQNSPAIAPLCSGGNFDYIGQPLTYSVAPVLTVTARSMNGAITQNYKGSFFKLTNASITGRNYITSVNTLNQSLPSGDPTVLSLANGAGTLTFNSNAGISYVRSTPIAPFKPTLTLSFNIIDADGVAASKTIGTLSTNPWIINAPSIDTQEQRYGRIAFSNAVGSELLNLPLPMHAEYFLSTTAGFTQNANDSCTTGVTLAPPPPSTWTYGGNLGAGETCVMDTGAPGASGAGCSVAATASLQFKSPPAGGDFNLVLRAPGATNDGTVKVWADVPAWLKFDWDASTSTLENPSGTASFGMFPGRSKRIFQAEK